MSCRAIPRSAPGFDGGTDVRGRTAGDTSATSIGAHARHLTAGILGVKVACDECHEVPATVAPGHLDNQVTVTFGAVAKNGGLSPSYDPATKTCSNVYCHGAVPGFKAGVQPIKPSWGEGRGDAVFSRTRHDLASAASAPPGDRTHAGLQLVHRSGLHLPPRAVLADLRRSEAPHRRRRNCPPSCDPITP